MIKLRPCERWSHSRRMPNTWLSPTARTQAGGAIHTDAIGVAQLREVLHRQVIQLCECVLEFLIVLLDIVLLDVAGEGGGAVLSG